MVFLRSKRVLSRNLGKVDRKSSSKCKPCFVDMQKTLEFRDFLKDKYRGQRNYALRLRKREAAKMDNPKVKGKKIVCKEQKPLLEKCKPCHVSVHKWTNLKESKISQNIDLSIETEDIKKFENLVEDCKPCSVVVNRLEEDNAAETDKKSGFGRSHSKRMCSCDGCNKNPDGFLAVISWKCKQFDKNSSENVFVKYFGPSHDIDESQDHIRKLVKHLDALKSQLSQSIENEPFLRSKDAKSFGSSTIRLRSRAGKSQSPEREKGKSKYVCIIEA